MMKKVSVFVIITVGIMAGGRAFAEDAVVAPTARTADQVLSALYINADAPTTIRYHGDDESLGQSGLAHTDGSHYNNSYISSGFGAVHAAAYQNQWQVEWPANTPGATSGVVVKGIAQCTRAKKKNGRSTSDAAFADTNYDMIQNPTTKTEDGERQCWCQMTGVKDSAGVAAPDAASTWLEPSSAAPWVFANTYGSAAPCARNCAYYCAYLVRDYASFRAAVLGFRGLGESTNRPMCGENLISGYAGDFSVPRTANLLAGTYTVAILAADGKQWAVRLRNVSDKSVVTGEALTTAAAALSAGGSTWAVSSDAAAAAAGWLIGPDANNATFTLPAEYIVEIAKLDATSVKKMMLVRGTTAPSAELAENACIVISTNANSDASFSRSRYVLDTVVQLTKRIVSDTINQTAAVAALYTGKQTMPDASNSNDENASCPNFRQCLLIEDDSGTPHWYVIKDPVRDLVLSLKNNKVNSSGETTTTAYAANGYDGTVSGTTDSRYYKGYVAMRQLADSSTSVYTRQFTSAMLNGANGGQYKTLNDQEWAVTWQGNETGTANSFLPGVIYGVSRCAKTKPSSTAAGTDGWNTIENSDPVNDSANIASYVQCYCKMTGVGMDGEITPVKNSSAAPWVFNYTRSSAAICAARCASYCAYNVRGDASFRAAVLGFAAN